MVVNREELETLREGWDFEAKKAAGRDGKGTIPESMWETYSAMANTAGGVILLGAKERSDGTLLFTGLEEIVRVETDLWNQLQNPQKVSANILSRRDVEQIEVGDTALLLIRVPKANRGDRPVYINGSWERGTFVRVHEGDRRVSSEVARRMLADAVKDRNSGLLEDFTLDDLSEESVRRYREVLAARRSDHPFLAKKGEEFLIAIGAAGRKRRGEKRSVHPTWAGLWMLGDEVAIRELCPHWHLSYMELPDVPDVHTRWLDRVHPDGMWNANLFEFYRRVIVKLHDGLKVPFRIEQGQYRKDETPVHDAIREALVNTIAHADYQGTTGVKVRKKRSGFEFINPGLLLVSAEQLWKGGVSEPRNPSLHRMFSLVRLGEREGSGGPAMRNVWRAEHWRMPRVWEDVEHLETHLELPLESLLPDDAVAAVDERFGARFRNLDELGRVILVTAQADGSINHGRIRELSDAHPRDITLKLQELVRNGFLDSSGGPRWMTYSIAERGGQAELVGLEREPNGASATANGTSSAANGISSAANDTSSAASDISASTNGTGSAANDTGTPSALERVRSAGRASRDLVKDAIVEVCADEFLPISDIAERVNRATATVRRIVPDLVNAGRLEMRYPDAATHQAQAYRSSPTTLEGSGEEE